jgi:1-acyl-sn-glycerol-3-phosphate acyltransferase
MSDSPSKIPAILRAPLEYAVLYSSLLVFGVGGLAFTLVALIIRPCLPRETGHRIGRRTMRGLFRFFTWYIQRADLVRLDLRAIDRLRDEKGLIIAPNHISLCDAVFLISRLPNAVCIIKAKIWDNPILAGGARLAGYLRNDAPGSMVKEAASELRRGTQLLIFPEGTRTVRPPVNPLKGGCALIARQSGAPVQTVIVRANTPFFGKKNSVFRLPRFPVRYVATLGERLVFNEVESTKDFLRRLEGVYHRELESPDSPPHADR